MTLFKVALLQLKASKIPSENLTRGIEGCKKAKALGADLALFPEMWQIGYVEKAISLKNAIELSDVFITTFQKLAQDLQMAIAITYLGKNLTNAIAIIDQSGKILLEYAKVHTCVFDNSENRLESGKEFKVATLSFARGDVKIGAMICFDREYPESARTLMLKGAEIILIPNSCDMHNDPIIGDVRLAQLRSRALENMVGVALCNYPHPKNDGHSCAFHTDGSPLVIADEKEGVFLASFDIEKIRKWQKYQVWGAKYRHPEAYL